MLQNRRRDLLFSCFGISDVRAARERESQVTRNIQLKKGLTRELRADPNTVDWERARSDEPYRQFAHSDAIIHNVDGDTYELTPCSIDLHSLSAR